MFLNVIVICTESAADCRNKKKNKRLTPKHTLLHHPVASKANLLANYLPSVSVMLPLMLLHYFEHTVCLSLKLSVSLSVYLSLSLHSAICRSLNLSFNLKLWKKAGRKHMYSLSSSKNFWYTNDGPHAACLKLAFGRARSIKKLASWRKHWRN